MRRRSPTPPPPDRVAVLLKPRPRGGAPLVSAGPFSEYDAIPVVGAGPAADHEGIPLPSADPSRSRRGPLLRRPRHRSQEAPAPPLVTLPGPLRHVRIRPAWGAVLGLALVGLVAAAILGVRAWGAANAAEPTAVPPPVRSGSGTPAAGGSVSAASGSAASPGGALRSSTAPSGAPPSGIVVVHVVGQVKTPGVVRLASGARVEDAVRAAGGAAGAAQLSGLNLARVLVDGEQVLVPALGDPVAAGAAPGAVPGSAPRAPGARIDLNTADVATLDTLPGVGPVTAAKIVEWRTAHGRFTAVDELAEVPGIGPKLLEQLAPLVRV